MRKNLLFILSLSILIFILTACEGGESKKIRIAKDRVNLVLKGIKHVGPGVDDVEGSVQTSICMWAKGVLFIWDYKAFGWASDDFDKWRTIANIYPYVKEYTVTNGVVDGDSVIVAGTIDGAEFTMLVTENKKITWIKMPEFN